MARVRHPMASGKRVQSSDGLMLTPVWNPNVSGAVLTFRIVFPVGVGGVDEADGGGVSAVELRAKSGSFTERISSSWKERVTNQYESIHILDSFCLFVFQIHVHIDR